MSRDDEETDDPGAVDEHAVPGDPVDMSKREPVAEAPEAAPFFTVVISADGSAAIDGVPVAAVGGEAVDAAILDTLHRYASDRDRPVMAAISDPSVENVTFVEVAPDGSSRLVEQPSEHGPVPPGPAGPGGPVGPPDGTGGPFGEMYEAEHPHPYGEDPLDDDLGAAPGAEADDDGFDGRPAGEDDEFADLEDDDAAYALPESPGPPPPPPLTPGPPPRRPKTDRSGAARQSDDEFRPSGLLHRPLVVGPVALGVAALVIVPLALLGGGSNGDGQKNKAAGASDELTRSPASHAPTTAPTVSVSPSLSPSPSASPKPKKHKPKGTAHADGASGVTTTVTVRPPKATATVTAKPAPDTAATAVNRLAKDAPGRHICYRAYVAGRGWQKPVCDGTVAGTTNQNRPIKALNIAVRGTGGVAANAFVHKPGSTDGKGVWKPHWTANTADGKDIYIGSAKKSAPNVLGFAINIGSGGQICQSAHVRDADWGKWGCVNPRPEYVFGGTLSNDLWLDAVKFTV